MRYNIGVEHHAFGNEGLRVANVPVEAQTVEEALELAFMFTNTMDWDWFRPSAITGVQLTPWGQALVNVNGGIRSTSVGDRLVVAEQNDKVYEVSDVGFTPTEHEAAPPWVDPRAPVRKSRQ